MRREKRFEILECSQRRKISLIKKHNVADSAGKIRATVPLISIEYFISDLIGYLKKKIRKASKNSQSEKTF